MYCRKWDSRKSFIIAKRKLESWKLIKQKNEYGPPFIIEIRRFKGASQIS